MSNSSHYDYVVIGGGSGGMASARRAAQAGAKVAVVEKGRLGGTCVNVGCVPKKVMFSAAALVESADVLPSYGFPAVPSLRDGLDFGLLKQRRDKYVARLNGIYLDNLTGSGVDCLTGTASFTAPKTLDIDGQSVSADHILIATGGYPSPVNVPGFEHAINSDGFFDLEKRPDRVAVVGGGYIAVELAGILATLGSSTDLLVRSTRLLRPFDDMLSTRLAESMTTHGGVNIQFSTSITAIERESEETLLVTKSDGTKAQYDTVLFAAGRSPAVNGLNLEAAGVSQRKSGHINVDEQQNTSVEGVYALGDVCGKAELTPVAVAAGRLLADRLFSGRSDAALDYTNIPTVMFSHPTIGTIGLTEDEAVEKHGAASIQVFKSSFVDLSYGILEPLDSRPTTHMKLVCAGSEQKVVGLHVIGKGADEMLQGFGVAMKMGATKRDFDNCVAIHPTAAEEFVTLAPWNPAP